MTHSPTPAELLAIRTGNAALLNSPDAACDIVATIVFALGSAGLLMDPETAAELATLRKLLPLATVLEIPRPGNALPLQLRRSYGHADRWAICDREGRRWDRELGWCPEFGGIADDRLRDSARFTLAEAVPLAQQLADSAPDDVSPQVQKLRALIAGQRAAVEDPHDSPLHHTYAVCRDLPEVTP